MDDGISSRDIGLDDPGNNLGVGESNSKSLVAIGTTGRGTCDGVEGQRRRPGGIVVGVQGGQIHTANTMFALPRGHIAGFVALRWDDVISQYLRVGREAPINVCLVAYVSKVGWSQ